MISARPIWCWHILLILSNPKSFSDRINKINKMFGLWFSNTALLKIL